MIGTVGALATIALFAAGPAAAPTVGSSGDVVDNAKYAEVLASVVKDARVDYPALQKDRAKLDAYLTEVGGVTRARFDAASKDARMVYLVNAYNAYTLQAIVDNYPIKKGGGFFNTAPANSIKQIKGVWDTTRHKTALGNVTLDDIEHKNLRASYATPILHMALVCASKGCPPLRGEPYSAATLNAQLEDQARTYLSSGYGMRVEGTSVTVSYIFKWFAKDFTKPYGNAFGFVEAFAPADKVEAFKKARAAGGVGYLEYDWTLNEKQ